MRSLGALEAEHRTVCVNNLSVPTRHCLVNTTATGERAAVSTWFYHVNFQLVSKPRWHFEQCFTLRYVAIAHQCPDDISIYMPLILAAISLRGWLHYGYKARDTFILSYTTYDIKLLIIFFFHIVLVLKSFHLFNFLENFQNIEEFSLPNTVHQVGNNSGLGSSR